MPLTVLSFLSFFFNDTATTEIYTLSLHDALPISIEILAPHVQGIHAKDGLWPTNPRELGREVPIGQGKVDFPRIIARLKQLNYQGAVTIEREVSGPEQIEDVRAAKVYLEGLIG